MKRWIPGTKLPNDKILKELSVTEYKKYPEYKDSGVEWTGEIPSDWSVRKVGNFFYASKGKNSAILTKEYCGLNPGVHPVYSGQTANNGVMGAINTFEIDSGEEGILFATTVGEKAMTVKQLFGKFSLSQNCMIFAPNRKNECISFYNYQFQTLFGYERTKIPQDMQPSFRVNDFYNYKFLDVPLDTQKQIVAFLDTETKKIDDSVASMESLISLLTEKRSALISETVTRGIPGEHSEFKDSGVEWLGAIPAGWTVYDPKNSFSLKSEIPLVGDTHLMASQKYGVIPQSEYLEITGKRVVEVFSTEARFKHIDKDDFLIHLRSFQGGIEHCVNTGKVTAAYTVVSPKKEVMNPLYARYLLKSRGYIGGIASTTNQLRDGQSIKWKDFRKIKLPIPPIDEQHKIYEYLSVESNKIDTIVNEAKKSIEVLKEKRQTLISDAVTGKIDVRDIVN